MENRWDALISLPMGDDLAQAHYLAQLIQSESSLEQNVSSSLSIKAGYPTVFGTEEPGLAFLPILPQLSSPVEEIIWLNQNKLTALANIEDLPKSHLLNEIQLSRLQNYPAEIPLDVLLHAIIPAKVVAITHPAELLSILHTDTYQQRMASIYGSTLLAVEKGTSILSLARRAAKETWYTSDCLGAAIPGYGLIVFGDTPLAAYQNLVEIVTRAEQYLDEQKARKPALQKYDAPNAAQVKEIPALRLAISGAAGHPVVITLDQSELALNFAKMDHSDPAALGPVLTKHSAFVRAFPLIGRDIQAYAQNYSKALQTNAAGKPELFDTTPRVILDPQLGVLTIGRTSQAAAQVKAVYQANMEMILQSALLGSCSPIEINELLEDEISSWPDASNEQTRNRSMAGEVALVTGAASGIGKACVESFLDRGAAVVGLDINPAIESLFSLTGYLGIKTDITNEDAIRAALLETIRRFGGLDMLVLNAGIFPSGCRIDALSLALWDQVRKVNLDANLILMRESFPLLKSAPNCGRVVIVGSRNQRAPGPGAAAYSVSKAAVTQLARVAALEWGDDHIRINVIHPDSVFDTALYTEEILKNRSAMYGMTVEQYKRRNVLKVEITSHDISEMAVEMCGPLFSKVTGAQIPVDGGNERVI